MSAMTRKAWTAALVLAGMAVEAGAGEFQLAWRVGETKVDIDAEHLVDGVDRHDDLMNSALTASYRWSGGPFVEIGWSGSAMIFSGTDLGQNWIGAGWQFDPHANWKITPRAGLTFSHLDSTHENIFQDGEPRTERNDTVPYVELTVEYKFYRHFGLGLYARENFEAWGVSRSTGLMISWTFLPAGN